jgi:hypothetical protein
MKKKNLELGRHLGIIVAEDSKIPKMLVINPLQELVHPQTQRNYPAWIVKSQPQHLRIRLFLVTRSAD